MKLLFVLILAFLPAILFAADTVKGYGKWNFGMKMSDVEKSLGKMQKKDVTGRSVKRYSLDFNEASQITMDLENDNLDISKERLYIAPNFLACFRVKGEASMTGFDFDGDKLCRVNIRYADNAKKGSGKETDKIKGEWTVKTGAAFSRTQTVSAEDAKGFQYRWESGASVVVLDTRISQKTGEESPYRLFVLSKALSSNLVANEAKFQSEDMNDIKNRTRQRVRDSIRADPAFNDLK